MKKNKIVIYQVLPRLFGNTNAELTPNGTLEQNGCGKLNDFTDTVLKEIRALGSTHIWYTGIIEHATQTAFKKPSIPTDHPGVLKGKAGSPYAIKDYYDVAPSLATNVTNRMKEFEELVVRSHKNDLRVIIDFVPNHVARQYKSNVQPKGTIQLGAKDKKTKAFDPNNNFYYIPNTPLTPTFDMSADGVEPYTENPARATGNDQFTAYPNRNDWYETVKLNYGIDYQDGRKKHFNPIPNTWEKMRDILLFWASKKIDGFRCDMVEMVPVEFWSWVIPIVKQDYPQIVFIAEAYDPNQYHNYLFEGKFDYLYDKVGLYDTLKNVMNGSQPASDITACWQTLNGMDNRMLNFLENHDEQRIASDFFANNPFKAIPAMAVASCINVGPVMVYFGQEFGERGMDQEGYSGLDGRTTIFDYWSVDTVRRWFNEGHVNLINMSEGEEYIYNHYKRILNIAREEQAITQGVFFDLMYANPFSENFNPHRQYTFIRKYKEEIILVVANFDSCNRELDINIPQHAFDFLGIKPTHRVEVMDLMEQQKETISFAPDAPSRVLVNTHSCKILKLLK